MKNYLLGLSLLTFFGVHGQSGSVTLNDGMGAQLSSHASIAEAYAAIPATLTQAYIIEISDLYLGSSETYPIIFGLKTGASTSNTITLRPAAGSTSATIAGNSSGSSVLRLDDADYVIIDGRPGGQGTTGSLSISNSGTTSSSNTIEMVNGACFNEVRYCDVLNATTSSAGRNILFGTSASNTSGNSDNLIEYCHFPSGRYRINSSGTVANPNTRNMIRTSSFENMTFVGFWGQNGTGKVTIDSCTFYGTTASGSGLFFGILFDSQNDTTVISNNYMYDMQNASSGNIRYIHIRSTAAGNTNLTYIYNNMLSINEGNAINTNVVGIEYSGSNPSNGKIVNNSIYVGGVLTSAGTSGAVASAGITINTSSAVSTYEIKNNLVTNQRTGGTGVQHVAYYAQQTAPVIDADYNSYSAGSGELVRYGATVYSDITLYQAAVNPAETNTNDVQPNFISLTDLHLDASEIGNTSLQGIIIPYVTTDIDNEPRIFPYRGADETANNDCTGTPDAGSTVASADTLCMNDAFTVYVNGSDFAGMEYQWQISTDGINFTDIMGAMDTLYNGALTQTTYYRCMVTCVNSGDSDSSDAVVIVMLPAPSGGTISATQAAYTFDFSISGMSGSYSYAWDFGDGGTSTDATPSHTYGASGSYPVQVIISNDCDSDTLEYSVVITLGLTSFDNSYGFGLYPNPVDQELNLSALNYDELVSITLTDLSGKTYKTWSNVQLPVTLPLENLHLAPGIYLVKIFNGEVNSLLRFQKR